MKSIKYYLPQRGAQPHFPLFHSTIFLSPTPRPIITSCSGFHLQCSSFTSRFPTNSSGRCQATNPRTSSPESDPPPGKDTPPLNSDMEDTFSMIQDKVQIFLAVLFWMSLFFWTCAWDDRNDGRPTKGSRFRR
ncbi:hypothetical protein GIB67_017815 [Kingdonia uniflora]|uniref:Uncharacterized protein n=1 Tax=Kingdonia uniflora TaxID=39325 RepID=A0A7J7MP18_9MAGN|nr:hypothetical protein GIB67_017815 [Kingdonia uniflora]